MKKLLITIEASTTDEESLLLLARAFLSSAASAGHDIRGKVGQPWELGADLLPSSAADAPSPSPRPSRRRG